MSTGKRLTPSSTPPKKGSSGEHPAVQAMREKFASIEEGQLEQLTHLNKRVDQLCKEDGASDGAACEAPTQDEKEETP